MHPRFVVCVFCVGEFVRKAFESNPDAVAAILNLGGEDGLDDTEQKGVGEDEDGDKEMSTGKASSRRPSQEELVVVETIHAFSSPPSLSAPVSIGAGTSCHQCKNSRPGSVFHCQHILPGIGKVRKESSSRG